MGRRVARAAVAAAVVWMGAHALAACGDTTTPDIVDEDPTADVIYDGGANDEALDVLLAATLVDDVDQAAHVIAPTMEAPLSRTEAPEFSWQVGAPTAKATPNGSPPDRATDKRQRSLSSPPAMASWLISSAHAHGAPVNGRAYLLVIEDERGDVVYRVFTTNLKHLVPSAIWADITAGSETMTVSILHAVFTNDAIADNGGPWLGPSVRYTL